MHPILYFNCQIFLVKSFLQEPFCNQKVGTEVNSKVRLRLKELGSGSKSSAPAPQHCFLMLTVLRYRIKTRRGGPRRETPSPSPSTRQSRGGERWPSMSSLIINPSEGKLAENKCLEFHSMDKIMKQFYLWKICEYLSYVADNCWCILLAIHGYFQMVNKFC